MRIGYGVAVVPLHHPLRLAEEIAWLTHLSGGRVMVGVGPGFSEREFAGYGVPIEERHARFEDGLAIVRCVLTSGEIEPLPLAMPPFDGFHRGTGIRARVFDTIKSMRSIRLAYFIAVFLCAAVSNAAITGTVVDQYGAPVAGAIIWLFAQETRPELLTRLAAGTLQ